MKSIRWGLIGCGDVVRKRVAQAILDEPRSQLVAACRRDVTRLPDFCAAFGIPRAYESDEDLLRDADIDVVYIATPVREHLPQTVAAANAGKHVLVEKPMAMTVAECDQMITACRDAGVKLGVAYYRRFYPLFHRINELISDGEIGAPMAVSATTTTPLTQESGEEPEWRVRRDLGGGGSLMDIGSHRINLFTKLFGEVAEVKSICHNVVASYEAEETAVMIVRFQCGVVGTLQCHFGSRANADEFAVLGTRGRLSTPCLNGDTLVIDSNGGRRVEQHPPPNNLCGPLISDFTSALLDDREPTVSGEEGRATNGVIQRAYTDAVGQR